MIKFYLKVVHEEVSALILLSQTKECFQIGWHNIERIEGMTELERLQEELEYLRAENAILKKLRELRLKEEKEQEEKRKLFKD